MHWKTSPEGILAYIALAAYLIGALLWLFKQRRAGWLCYALGASALLGALGWRGWTQDRWPLRDMFEIFLALACLSFPLSLLCAKLLKIRGQGLDMLLGGILLVPAGFVFPDISRPLPAILQTWIFAPHVLAYLCGYILLFKAGGYALLSWNDFEERPTDAATNGTEPISTLEAARRLTLLAFPLITLGLALGAYWGQLAWGSWWNFDPKEMWALCSWLFVCATLYAHQAFPQQYSRVRASLHICTATVVIITLVVVNLSRIFGGLHSYAG